jgi:uncharacterized protein YecT (DUF1311 family)
MLQVDLSTLSTSELRQLLDSARRQGEASTSYKILQEMAVRRETGRRRRGASPGRRPSEPRVVEMNLGDPMAREDEDVPAAPAAVAPPEPEPRETAGAEPAPSPPSDPIAVEAPEADGDGLKDFSMPRPVGSPPSPRRSGWPRAVVFAFGLAAGLGLGLGLGFVSRDAVPAAAVQPAPPSAALPVGRTPTPVAAEPVAAEPVPSAPDAVPPAPAGASAVPPPPLPPLEVEDLAREAVAPSTPAVADRAIASAERVCEIRTTPADRAICAAPELQRLQRRLQTAYSQALEAHQDRALLRQRQLAWRDERNSISDPARLAAIYEQRIRKLDAAAAEARRRH